MQPTIRLRRAAGLRGAEEYLAKEQPLAWALAALMRPGPMSRAEHKLTCLRRIAAAPLTERQRLPLVNCVETYLELTGRDAAELEALQAAEPTEEVQVMRKTWAEKLETKGFRQALLSMLGARFGPLPEEVKRRVEAIGSTERLDQIAQQVGVANSLEEMGLGS